jgi:hypothetical protein
MTFPRLEKKIQKLCNLRPPFLLTSMKAVAHPSGFGRAPPGEYLKLFMKNINIRNRGWMSALALLALFTFNSDLSTVHAQGTAFTYQGQLLVGGGPANGNFDFTFALYPTDDGGVQVGSTITQTNIGVTNGLFVTTLDFGAVFTGNPTWLSVDVRTNGGTSFTPLTPWQELTPTPYAIYAETAATASNVSGTVPVAQLSGIVPLTQLPGAVVNTNETTVTLDNLKLDGSLNLPSPSVINTHDATLLYADGSGNIFAGLNAGFEIAGGYNNSALGDYALAAEIIGDNNTASGYAALNFNNADNNTAIGSGALYYSTTGSNNTGIGVGALENSTADSQLVAIGYQALQNDNAYSNIFTSSGTGENTAVGYQALQSNTLGFDNTSIGYKALNQITNGYYNTATGTGALEYSASGNLNTATGAGALTSQYVGSDNTADGAFALYSQDSGSNNTAIGSGALEYSDSANDNTATGALALSTINAPGYLSAGGNTADGAYALSGDETGYNNTAVGFQALYADTNGVDNVAIGVDALQADSNGSLNTAVGTYAFQYMTNGAGNIGLGYGAGINLVEGSNNIYVGNNGNPKDNDTIRIGNQGTQTTTVVAGIYGASVPGGEAANLVIVDLNGHLASTGTNNSYTPTIGDGTNPFTTTTQSGYYSQVGSMVYFEIWLRWMSKGSAVSGDAVRISLPLAVASQRVAFPVGFVDGVTFVNQQLTAGANNGDAYLLLYSLSGTGGGAANEAVGDCGTSGEIQLSGWYRWQ